MRADLDKACEQIDAAIYTGDVLCSDVDGEANREGLRSYIKRWEREIVRQETQEFYNLLERLHKGEHTGLTCIGMAIKQTKKQVNEIAVNQKPQEVYDDLMAWLKPDFDKLRCASTDDGKELERLIAEWRSSKENGHG